MSQKSIIITGASSGIGRVCAQRFLDENYLVGLIGRRSDALFDVANGNPSALVLPCDVSVPDNVDHAFEKAYDVWGRIDVLFNNAGISPSMSTIDELEVDDWDNAVNVNFNGAFYCARKAFEIMRRQTPKGGRIINNGSISAHAPRPGTAAYTATKHAITGLTKAISLDGRQFNIACGQIDIGNARTDMVTRIATGIPQADGSNRAEPTMPVEDVAKGVVQMAEFTLETNVQFMTIMATAMPFVGRG